jgi:RNA polymerase-binding transcription factor DksA
VDPERVAAELAEVEADLAGVESALRRLDDGSYGRCEVCGQAIDDAELASRPTARACADHGGA